MNALKARGPRRRAGTTGCLMGALLAAAALWAACATKGGNAVGPGAPRRITDFLTIEDQATVTLIIRGDQPLTYSAAKQADPLGLWFQFPDTVFVGLNSVYLPPANKVIHAIRLAPPGGGEPEARVFLELLQDASFAVMRDNQELRVVFSPPAPPVSKPAAPARKPPPRKAPAVPDQPKTNASILQQVTVEASPDGVVIRVRAEGPVPGIKAFTIDEHPAKIVVDLPGMRSVYSGEQRITVQSPCVSRVRHFGHPDKVRLVAETRKPYLNDFTVDPTADGLVIRIGRVPAMGAAQEETRPADSASGENR